MRIGNWAKTWNVEGPEMVLAFQNLLSINGFKKPDRAII